MLLANKIDRLKIKARRVIAVTGLTARGLVASGNIMQEAALCTWLTHTHT
jgi:hypothetical protein